MLFSYFNESPKVVEILKKLRLYDMVVTNFNKQSTVQCESVAKRSSNSNFVMPYFQI